jgi:hypothetical protein
VIFIAVGTPPKPAAKAISAGWKPPPGASAPWMTRAFALWSTNRQCRWAPASAAPGKSAYPPMSPNNSAAAATVASAGSNRLESNSTPDRPVPVF